MLTRAAESFVAPLALEVVSGHRVYRGEWLEPNGSGQELHVSLAQWADVLLVAPATARRLAGLSDGWSADLLDVLGLLVAGPVIVAPAMHENMWKHPATQAHVARLKERGVQFVGPSWGPLASGESGWGRLAPLEEIVAAVLRAVRCRDLEGCRAVVTAGPTREPLDPVRYLSNRSSGKMGFAIAAELQSRGAEVVLIAGPVSLPTPPGVQRIDVETALEMAARVRETVPQADVCVMAAAISDFRAASVSPAKLKRSAGPPKVELVHNPDILASLSQWAPRAFRVGFAAEVGESSAEAYRKLAERNVDWIVANDVSRADIGFDSDDNEVIVYRREREPFKISKRSKPLVARALVDALAIELRERGILDAKIRAT